MKEARRHQFVFGEELDCEGLGIAGGLDEGVVLCRQPTAVDRIGPGHDAATQPERRRPRQFAGCRTGQGVTGDEPVYGSGQGRLFPKQKVQRACGRRCGDISQRGFVDRAVQEVWRETVITCEPAIGAIR